MRGVVQSGESEEERLEKGEKMMWGGGEEETNGDFEQAELGSEVE